MAEEIGKSDKERVKQKINTKIKEQEIIREFIREQYKMNAEMNQLNLKISKWDIFVSIIVAVICIFVFSIKIALIYVLGLIVGLVNYLCSVKIMDKYFINNGRVYIFLFTLLRIFIVSLIIIPFIYDISSVFAYIGGFVSNQIVIIFCTISRKGSA